MRPPVPRLLVTTRETDPDDDALRHADPASPLVWLRRGDGMVAAGEATRVTTAPGDDTTVLADRWRALAAAADVDDAVRLPGTGLVAFGALPFDDRSAAGGVLIVPRRIVGRRGDRAWLTTVRVADDVAAPDDRSAPTEPVPYGPHWSGTLGPGALTASGYVAAVRAGLDAIADGRVEKVVVARDLRGSIPADADLRRLVRALASDYPDTWVFAVDGLIGASPETLVTADAGTVTARVLAGTMPRGANADADIAAAAALASSAKDLDEHAFAVQSVLATLRPHTRALAAADTPFTLKLPNVWHLATDVAGELDHAASALDLLRAVHPTAAVAGTPTAAAVDLIRELEPFDRGRYAGPVGWVDGAGNGEWAIALRCAQVGAPGAGTGGIGITAYAGAGIVAGSDPDTELLETRVKFRPIVDALA